MSADASELYLFAAHLQSAIDRCEDDLSKVVERGAVNIKRGAPRRLKSWSRGRYLKHYMRSFSYDMLSPLEAEIGPDASKPQGKMGRGVELGSVHTAPSPHLFPAFEEEQPRFEAQVERVLWRSIRD